MARRSPTAGGPLQEVREGSIDGRDHPPSARRRGGLHRRAARARRGGLRQRRRPQRPARSPPSWSSTPSASSATTSSSSSTRRTPASRSSCARPRSSASTGPSWSATWPPARARATSSRSKRASSTSSRPTRRNWVDLSPLRRRPVAASTCPGSGSWARRSDGRLIGLPTDVGSLAVCYRKDLFEAAGLPTERDAGVGALAGLERVHRDRPEVQAGHRQGRARLGHHRRQRACCSRAAATCSTRHSLRGDDNRDLIADKSPAVKNAWDTAVKSIEPTSPPRRRPGRRSGALASRTAPSRRPSARPGCSASSSGQLRCRPTRASGTSRRAGRRR